MNNTVSPLDQTAAVILAAGKGKRMNLTEQNKVTTLLGTKPIILHVVKFMRKLGITTVVVVVGYAKESVMQALATEDVLFAEQTEQLGTGHAVECALSVLPDHIKDILVVYGDDAVLYNTRSMSSIERVFSVHNTSQSAVTFLTIDQENPTGLGRVLRDTAGKVIGIKEEKDASAEEKLITEINPGCFLFSLAFLKQYLSKVQKSPVTGEYYLTSLVDLAFTGKERIEAVRGGQLPWRGVNTAEELQMANVLYNQIGE